MLPSKTIFVSTKISEIFKTFGLRRSPCTVCSFRRQLLSTVNKEIIGLVYNTEVCGIDHVSLSYIKYVAQLVNIEFFIRSITLSSQVIIY